MSHDFTFTFTDPENLVAKLPMGAVGKSRQDIAEAAVTGSGHPTIGHVTFAIVSGLTCKIEAFNSLNDKDEDNVFGKSAADGSVRHELGLEPTLVHDPAKAWLKYSARASLAVDSDMSDGTIAIGVDTQSDAILADYRCHDARQPTLEAFQMDMPPRSMLSIADIQALGAGDALLYGVRGTLGASVKMTWGDVFSGSLNSLTGLLKNTDLIAIETEVGATADVNVTITDDFRAIITNAGDGKLRLAVKKARLREWDDGAKIGVTVAFADPKKVKEILVNAILAVAGSTIDEINAMFDTVDPSQWDERITNLLESLDLMKYVNHIDELKKQWDALQDAVYREVDAVANARLEAGLNCDYHRITEDESVLQITMPMPDVASIHTDILTCNLKDILAYADDSAHDVTIERYLRQKTVIKKFAWGFSLGIAEFAIRGKDLTKRKWVERTRRHDNVYQTSMSFLGSRGYTSSIFGEKSGWTVDFSATMDKWQLEPKTKDYTFGLSLSWILEDNEVTRDEFYAYLDYALIFGAVRFSDRPQILDVLKLKKKKSRLKSMKLIVDLRFTHDQLIQMLAVPDDSWRDLMIRAMAKAMPYMKDIDVRDEPLKREAFYSSYWREYFDDKKCSFDDIKQYGHRELNQLEATPHNVSNHVFGPVVHTSSLSFAYQLMAYGKDATSFSGIVSTWNEFYKGLIRLRDAMLKETDSRELEDIFEWLCAYFSQSLFTRAAGIFLIELARAAGITNAAIDSTMKITAKDAEFQFRSLQQ
ncbi:hypothetical protein JXA80_04695 [bacterium]|nr:hypothetical protein [candidate division CSSED10-310 bacterium]